MHPIQPIHTLELFPRLHSHLIELLTGLTTTDWQRPTVCKGWSVKDITAHLVDGHLRRIAIYRDQYVHPHIPLINSYQTLVDYLNQINQDWVVAARRLSPTQLIDWLIQVEPETYRLFKQLSPFDQAVHSVAWAGEQISPNWFHIAREYTELWHHQQQIRLAVDQTEVLMTAELYYPLLDTFMRALPHTYRQIVSSEHALIKVVITGAGGGAWFLYRASDSWQLVTDVDELSPNSVVLIDGQVAWRLFTKGLSTSQARPFVNINGDQLLGEPVLTMLSVMA